MNVLTKVKKFLKITMPNSLQEGVVGPQVEVVIMLQLGVIVLVQVQEQEHGML